MTKKPPLGAAIGLAKRPRAALLFLGLLLLPLAALYGAADKSGGTPPAAAAVRVDTALATRRDVPIYLEGWVPSRPSIR